MLHRSAGKPILIGLGAAAILAAGAVPVLAAPPDPTSAVSAETATADKPVTVTTTVKPDGESFEGMSVKVAVEAPATVDDIDCPVDSTNIEGGCGLSSISGAEEQIVTSTIDVPDDITARKEVTVTITVSYPPEGDESGSTQSTTTITFNPIPKPTPTPTPTPTKTSSSPSPSPTNSSSNNDEDDDNDSSGSSDSSSGSGSSSSSSGSGSAASSYTPPVPNGSFGTPPQNPQVALPPVAPLSPSVAPQAAPTPESRLQNNKAPVAQDLTFERMASTQVAWLAALLVAFSVLMTQLRLGRRRAVPTRALATTGRPAGSHRRPRRGLFSK